MTLVLRLRRVAVLACLLVMVGCRAKPDAPGGSIPTVSPRSVALPGSNDAADAPNAPAVSQSASGLLTAYSDPATGVSFSYPSAWRPWHAGSSMYPPALAQNGRSVNITQVFDPQGTAWAKTNLAGLSFSYAAHPQASVACGQLAETAVPGGREMPPERINGLSFSRVEASDAGMCHQVSTILNSVERNGTCFLFERDLETVCPEIRGPGNPVALTPAQTRALQEQLDRVMASVVLR